MSSSKYDKIGNYNLSYELLKDAIKEFDGYVLGLSQNDIWLFSNQLDKRPDVKVDEKLENFIKELAPRILDRTTGTYFFSDLLKADSIAGLNKYVKSVGDNITPKKLMTFIPGYYSEGLGSDVNSFVGAMFSYNPEENLLIVNNPNLQTVNEEIQLSEAQSQQLTIESLGEGIDLNGTEELADLQEVFGADGILVHDVVAGKIKATKIKMQDVPSKFATINDCIVHYNVSGLKESQVKKKVKDEETGETKTELQYEDADKKIPKTYTSDAIVNKDFVVYPEINKQTTGIPSREYSPALSALVIQHPKASNSSKGKDHLPIFFNAIPTIEMSRCVPYLDVRVLTENYSVDKNGNKTKPSKLNNVAYMRFIRQTDGAYVLDDSIGFGNLKPVNASIDQDERKATENIDIAYMDIFTTPQTFSNANINNSKDGMPLNKVNLGFGGEINDDPILEPIMPFLSLESLNVSITGAGYGIMSSKKASLKLTLHDRSRLRDLAPLVSSSQFATTRILIEYGWNHPEGGPNSDNTIGKYLNSLKERSVFQVTKCDYDFSDGGAVGINIGLAAYGFRQTERVHCGAGPEVPLNVFSEYIDKVNDDLRKNVENIQGSSKEKAPEVRQKLKMNARAARSTNNSLSWESYRLIMNSIKSGSTDSLKALKYVFELEAISDSEIKASRKKEIEEELNIGIIDPFGDNGGFLEPTTGGKIFTALEEAGLFQENTKETMLQRVYGKIAAFENPNIVDPFISSTVYGSNIQNRFISEEDNITESLLSSEIPSLQKISFTYNQGIADSGKSQYDYVTLGKAIANFIGYPLAATCLYDEVQMIFYPLNHQSAGGRVHTTASLPIPISRIREEVQTAVKSSSNISVKRMFSILEKIVKDKNLDVYRLSEVYNDIDSFNEKDQYDQLETILNKCCAEPHDTSFGFAPNQEENNVDYQILDNYNENIAKNYSNRKSLKEGEFSNKKTERNQGKWWPRLNKLLTEYKSQLASKIRKDISQKLMEIYKSDGLSTLFPALDKFVRPNISLDFEVVDAISATSDSPGSSFKQRLLQQIILPKDAKNGLHENKTILRLHIYDEETVMSPAELTLMSTMTDGSGGMIIDSLQNSEEIKDAKKSINQIAASLNFNQAKQYIKRTYPTLIYGAAGSTVRNLSVSANTSGEMANILMVESYGNLKQAQVGGINAESNFESVTMFPNTVSCTLMGIPMIGRGNTVFIDFGTNTSLDNIYTVKNVTHTIRAGDFSTTLELVPSNMGAVEGFAKNISKTFAPPPAK